MHYNLFGNFPPHGPIYQNDLIIFPVVLHCRRNCCIRGRYLCERSPSPVTWDMAELQQTRINGKFASGRILKILALVKSLNKTDRIAPLTEWVCLTPSDLARRKHDL